jgi:PAS domain S-box-containing protein
MELKKILVVEDENIIAKDLQLILSEAGYHVPYTAANSKDALKYAEELQPDLILMDVIIQGPVDGIATAHIISQTHDTPVIFLSAYSDKKTLERAKQLGSFGYLLKPCDDRELLIAVDFGIQKASVDRLLRDNNRLLKSALCHLEPGAIVVNLDGKIDLINSQAQVILGWMDNEINNRSVSDLIQNFDELVKENKETYEAVFNSKKNGSIKLAFKLQKISDNDKKPTGFLIYISSEMTASLRKVI